MAATPVPIPYWSVEFEDNAGSYQLVAMCRDCAHSAGGSVTFALHKGSLTSYRYNGPLNAVTIAGMPSLRDDAHG